MSGRFETNRKLLRQGGVASRYQFIDAERGCYPVALMCRVLSISRASYYAWLGPGVSNLVQTDQELSESIRQIHHQRRGTNGAPRIHAGLRAQGTGCGAERVARLMSTAELQGRPGRSRVRAMVADPVQPPAPNRVARGFTATQANQLWVDGITFIST